MQPPRRDRAACALAVLVFLAAGVLVVSPLVAEEQATPVVFPRGEIVDPVVSLADPTETYALYLPSAYTPERRWPILFILDARGRGRLAAELFREGAETYGWIVASSNNSASDGPWEPNERAINALLADSDRRFAADPRRVYVAGFSGTARGAWAVGLGIPQAVAGVIVASGGYPDSAPPTADLSFAVFGTAGTFDFNYQEMRRVAGKLEGLGVPYRLAVFAGRHAWPPAEIATEAVAWMELQAMRAGLRGRDEALIDRLEAGWMGEARAREAAGDPVGAWEHYREVARDFAGLRNVAEARAAADRLGASAAVTGRRAAEERVAGWEEARRGEVGELVGALQAPQIAPTPQLKARVEALIRGLQRTAGDAGGGVPGGPGSSADGKGGERAGSDSGVDALQAEAGRRVLEHLYAFLSFYVPRGFLASGAYARALTPLDLAVEIRDDNPLVWYNLACAEARAGSKKRALDALSHAVGAGFTDRAHAESDEDLASLRKEARFREIVDSMKP